MFGLSLLWSSITFGQPTSEAELIATAKSLMYSKNDISTIELNDMYGQEKLIILPFSGFIWADVLRSIPPQFLSNLTSQFHARNTAEDLIKVIGDRYQNTSYEESNSLVTRTNNDYIFCLVDDGLRKEFEQKKGVMKPSFAGLLPLYFQRDDLFDFVRHHESSHCLDDEFSGVSSEQKFLSVMINETKADLTATLVSANKNGNFDLFNKLIRPMRMTSVFDIEHTTEDVVGALIKNVDPQALKGLPFSEIMRIRSHLVAKIETPEIMAVLLKNAYEKEQVGLYLTQKFRQSGQVVEASVQKLLEGNQRVLDVLVPKSVVDGSDLDKRYNDMIGSVLENHAYYFDYLDKNAPTIRNFKKNLMGFGVEIQPTMLERINSLYK